MPTVPSVALPARFRPLTTAVVARRVRIAHGAVSRSALRAVGRPAATFGDVIHLANAPDASPATTELLAHELVHAANTPTRPRFFAEPGHDDEERTAIRVGSTERTAMRVGSTERTAMRVGSTERRRRSTDAVGGGTTMGIGRMARTARPSTVEPIRRMAAVTVAPRVVQRQDQPPAPPPPAAATTTITSGATTASSTPVIRRSSSGARRNEVIRRAVATDAVAGGDEPQTTTNRLDNFEELLDMLEQRILNELERRGGRSRGGW